jgi:hypothetical protein
VERWSAGDVVVRREVWRARPWFANPLYVVEDTDDLLVLYQPEGSPFGFGVGDGWPTVTGRHPYDGRTGWVGEGPLGLHRPGDPYAVWAYWGGADRRFMGWYVNIQVPFRRTPIGIDSLDLELDLLVTPQLEVVVKDEEQVDQSAALGRFSIDDAAAIHAAGVEVKRRIEEQGAWWDESWSEWSPSSELLEVPPLRDGWASVSAAPITSLLAPS